MKLLALLGCLLFTACAALPQLAQTVEDIATDDAITVKVDKDAFQKQTDVRVIIEVVNKDHAEPQSPTAK